ncbi:response regulator [Desulfobaculum bizertense]|uniref:Response regulator receiver domain-containing protein n=1 Tax=Desulfobaculum bizertense DSM 18034 TaxID=1121442 RepID=A0A1T4WRI4_9BACT|nr:response regulator [Desulfobaculum bizertense]SKA79231.1 Response regulator receiver domain-containing protein [Desulfobaculum bizertense DSM 18034]
MKTGMMTILLVDDEKRLLENTQKLFEKMNIRVLLAQNSNEALSIITRDPIDVIFLDIKMPGNDGMKTLQHIKRIRPLTEVIIITGHASMEDAVEGLKLGAMDFLVKPLSMKDLLKKAEEAFEKVRRHSELLESVKKSENL